MDSLIVSKKSKILAQSQYQAWLSSCAPVKSLNCGILLTLNYLSTKKPVKARHPSLFDFP
jgi:hypothetical protein